jgi:hypothetical protein
MTFLSDVSEPFAGSNQSAIQLPDDFIGDVGEVESR